MSDTILSIKNVSKKFNDVVALNDFNIDIKKGEFITILGPSGCGKTTLIRIIAGLETPDNGNVILDNVDVTKLLPEQRSVNTVFQNYALFPHMNVYDNIAYGLKIKKTPKNTIKQKVNEALELVKLKDYNKRKIHQLSGGQKQRVAIARALVLNPKVLLLDEPLGALDHNLRLSMQDELKKMQAALGTTFVYITHDQNEALNLSNRIILMNNSIIEQIGTPYEIYYKPQNMFVSKFVGESNILEGKQIGKQVDFGLFSVENDFPTQKKIYAVVRPENVIITDTGIVSTVQKQSINGGVISTELRMNDGKSIIMHGFDTPILSSGDNVNISVKNSVHYIYE